MALLDSTFGKPLAISFLPLYENILSALAWLQAKHDLQCLSDELHMWGRWYRYWHALVWFLLPLKWCRVVIVGIGVQNRIKFIVVFVKCNIPENLDVF